MAETASLVRVTPWDSASAAVVVLSAAVLALPIALDPSLYDAFALPKELLVLIASAGIWLTLALVGLPITCNRGLIAACAIAVVMSSLSFGLNSASAAPLGNFMHRHGYFALLGLAGLALGSASVAQISPHTLRSARMAGLMALLAVVIYALLQRVGLDPIEWSGSTPPFSFLGNPNDLAGYAVLATAFYPLFVRRGSPASAAATFAVIAASGFIVITTHSRSGAGCYFMALIISGIWYVWPRAEGMPPLRWFIPLAMGGGVVAACLIAAVSGDIELLTSRYHAALVEVEGNRTPDDSNSLADRKLLWDEAASSLSRHWLIGTGPDSFTMIDSTESGHSLVAVSPHSSLLEAALALGVPGAAAVASIAAFEVLASARRIARQNVADGAFPFAALVSFSAFSLVNQISIGNVGIAVIVLGLMVGGTTSGVICLVRGARARLAVAALAMLVLAMAVLGSSIALTAVKL